MTLFQFFNFSILIVFDWMAPLCNIHVHVHTLLSNFLVLNSHIIEFFFFLSPFIILLIKFALLFLLQITLVFILTFLTFLTNQ